MNLPDGGHAFPVSSDSVQGMSLLDYFAGQALVGLLSNTRTDGGNADFIAREVWLIAERMLDERDRRRS